jgi:hypothetical protein
MEAEQISNPSARFHSKSNQVQAPIYQMKIAIYAVSPLALSEESRQRALWFIDAEDVSLASVSGSEIPAYSQLLRVASS